MAECHAFDNWDTYIATGRTRGKEKRYQVGKYLWQAPVTGGAARLGSTRRDSARLGAWQRDAVSVTRLRPERHKRKKIHRYACISLANGSPYPRTLPRSCRERFFFKMTRFAHVKSLRRGRERYLIKAFNLAFLPSPFCYFARRLSPSDNRRTYK